MSVAAYWFHYNGILLMEAEIVCWSCNLLKKHEQGEKKRTQMDKT